MPFPLAYHRCYDKKSHKKDCSLVFSQDSLLRLTHLLILGVTGKPYLSCLSYHSHPIRPCGAPSPRGEGCDAKIPSSKKAVHHPCEPIRSPSTVIPSVAEGSLLLRLYCSLCSSVCMKHRIPPMLGASGFPLPFARIHHFSANEKDFSLALEMTVRESGILASLSFSRGKALVQGHDSPSFLWKEVPRRGGGWLTKRNKKQWGRSIFLYRHPERSRGIFVAILFLTSSADPFA